MAPINSKADRDHIRQKAGSSRAALDKIKTVIREYASGETPARCMLKIIRIVKGT